MRSAILIVAGVLALHTYAEAQTDERYCGPPARDSNNRIIRSAATTRWFQRLHPCPSTGLQSGSCPEHKDHVIPLACGGCDVVGNMQWLSQDAKRLKDATERRSYRPDPRYSPELFPGCPGP